MLSIKDLEGGRNGLFQYTVSAFVRDTDDMRQSNRELNRVASLEFCGHNNLLGVNAMISEEKTSTHVT
jgi:hypothetical protein